MILRFVALLLALALAAVSIGAVFAHGTADPNVTPRPTPGPTVRSAP
ncbi:hypothetical protein Val02_81890 [Virgisporangium aliadipatigenens]|uniref:Uncharacterized protein n=1 Tax=Virgisporangium aliadipatigenens TaxID=741659 RepID=A0A8J3YVJ0_9ACTN|nr:hypothetical protein [Virgisporangium aliadipatigenens]GIJ51303.1 hypothetical protein Val02_81890 [Virgisporangium aliadipatigenens]